MPDTFGVVISCEHATAEVPEAYRPLFKGCNTLLSSHRGWDPGALDLALHIGKIAQAPVLAAKATRLLVDTNRSLGHRNLFSEITRDLAAQEKQYILDHFYHPYRRLVEIALEDVLQQHERVLHLSIHSFTPVLNGEVRNSDLGLLYDPKRNDERKLAVDWKEHINQRMPELRIRMNYPYTGIQDGFVQKLRLQYPASVYLGYEIEINQAIVQGDIALWQKIQDLLTEVFLSPTGVSVG